MKELAGLYAERPDMQRVLKQLARELLLLESSDWQFLISTWSARDYAEVRCAEHFDTFQRLARMARELGEGHPVSDGDWLFLEHCEQRDAIFPDIDPRWFSHLDYPPSEAR